MKKNWDEERRVKSRRGGDGPEEKLVMTKCSFASLAFSVSKSFIFNEPVVGGRMAC